MKNYVCFALIVSATINISILNGQDRSGNVWCFGYNNQVSFNSGIPANASNTSMSTMSGSASIADSATGQLLFYTDGVSVWDNTNTQMPGNTVPLGAPQTFGGTLMPALITRIPGQPNKYYIFTTGATFNFTIIDMSLRGGLGDVSQQPQVVLPDNCSRMAGAYMPGGAGIWIIIQLSNTNVFYAYPLTSSTMGSPVVSQQGAIDSSAAYLKFSPDGTMLGAVFNKTGSGAARVQVFNFNAGSGIVSPAFLIDSVYPGASSNGGPSGLSFSPNSQLMYVGIAFDSVVYQYNLNAGSSAAILASRYQLISSYNGGSGTSPVAMQIASNQKIYVGMYNSHVLDAINYPNVYGNGCGYSQGAVYLNNLCMDGLPLFIDGIFVSSSNNALQCHITSTTAVCGDSCNGIAFVNVYNGQTPYSYLWQPGYFTTDTITNLCSGVYTLKITDAANGTLNDTITIGTMNNASPVINEDASQCGDAILCVQSAYSISWSDGSFYNCISVENSGTYSVTVMDYDGCSASAAISVSVKAPPTYSVVVNGDTFAILTLDSVIYQWFHNDSVIPGATSNTYDSTQPGVYSVLLTDTNGCSVSVTIPIYTIVTTLEQNEIKVYPNPFLDLLNIDLNNYSSSHIRITDLIGKTIFEKNGEKERYVLKNLATLAPGFYLIEVEQDGHKWLRKIIKGNQSY